MKRIGNLLSILYQIKSKELFLQKIQNQYVMKTFEVIDIKYYQSIIEDDNVISCAYHKFVRALVNGYLERIYNVYSVYFQHYKPIKRIQWNEKYKTLPEMIESNDYLAEQNGLFMEYYQELMEDEFYQAIEAKRNTYQILLKEYKKVVRYHDKE